MDPLEEVAGAGPVSMPTGPGLDMERQAVTLKCGLILVLPAKTCGARVPSSSGRMGP